MCIMDTFQADEGALRRKMESQEQTKRRRPKRAAAVLITLAGLLLIAAVLFGLAGRHVRFYMTGGAEITVPRGEPYVEPGVRAAVALLGVGEKELPVRVLGAVDTAAVGDCVLRYETLTMFRRFSAERLIHVADRTAPEITLLHSADYTPSWLEGYREEGYAAFDDVDGDLSDRVEIEERGDSRVYTVTDAAGNRASAVRQLPYSIGRPRLQLNGGTALEIPASLSFEDPGFSCTDARGNDLSAYVRCEGTVDPSAAGEYTLRYGIENALGERVEAVRTVTVQPLRNPDVVDMDGKLIYLTFDDGPGPYTERLLDILARYNVKASFFVTGLYPDYADAIGRAFREGHSIGVHSASHKYRRIYASEEAFLEDFAAMQEVIREQTGQETRLLRFPGGSSNTVSRFNRGIMSRLTERMSEEGYVYFDWNVSSGDAGGTSSTEQVFQNIVDGCSARRVSVVLQHDVKEFSVAAVERVIIWGLTNGYSFAALDETTEPVHHKLAN